MTNNPQGNAVCGWCKEPYAKHETFRGDSGSVERVACPERHDWTPPELQVHGTGNWDLADEFGETLSHMNDEYGTERNRFKSPPPSQAAIDGWILGRGIARHTRKGTMIYQCDKCPSVTGASSPNFEKWKLHHFTGQCVRKGETAEADSDPSSEVGFRYTFDPRGFLTANNTADEAALNLADVLREYQELGIPLELKVVANGIEHFTGEPDETGWRQNGICFILSHLAFNLHNDIWWQMPNEWRWAHMKQKDDTVPDAGKPVSEPPLCPVCGKSDHDKFHAFINGEWMCLNKPPVIKTPNDLPAGLHYHINGVTCSECPAPANEEIDAMAELQPKIERIRGIIKQLEREIEALTQV